MNLLAVGGQPKRGIVRTCPSQGTWNLKQALWKIVCFPGLVPRPLGILFFPLQRSKACECQLSNLLFQGYITYRRACLLACLLACVFCVCLFVCLIVCTCLLGHVVCLSLCLFVCLTDSFSLCPSFFSCSLSDFLCLLLPSCVYLSVCLSLRPSVFMFVCLSVSPSAHHAGTDIDAHV